MGLDVPDDLLDVYAGAAYAVAERDLDGVPRTSPAAAARHVVLGTLMFEPLLLALRRLAQEDVSARRFADITPTPAAAPPPGQALEPAAPGRPGVVRPPR